MYKIKRLILIFLNLVSTLIFIKTEDLKIINSNICIFDKIDINQNNICPLYNYELFNQKPIDHLYIKKTINAINNVA